ncbi:sensor histidine kinase [Pedobacter africanus]|uniref:Uncharacterized protein n=1 Tax=Pedobacter africanus TaxID=151894 RepID=A0ACC6L4A5_9SPHI|nr:histidine kinase [Pedobacter africanus]MDR6786327.1 hypothetical protein [Pedobacter africanus]
MKFLLLPIFLLCAFFKPVSARQHTGSADAVPSSSIIIKKRIKGKDCDTCNFDFALDAEPGFSYLITGSGHTPARFYDQLPLFKASGGGPKTFSSNLHLISAGHIGITFLPNFISEGGKRLQLYRNFGGEDYRNLEYLTEQNGRVIKPWAPLYSLAENKKYAMLGHKEVSGIEVTAPWKQTFYAGDFDLNIGDSLRVTIRNTKTKKIVKKISIYRVEDRATNFVYYQIPLTDEQLSVNLQNILNVVSGDPNMVDGRSSDIFEKDYNAVGVLRFHVDGHEELQYSFDNSPSSWQSVSTGSRDNVFLVLGTELPEGKDQDVYLRYNTQPQTVHQITIRVKPRPFQMPWLKITGLSTVLLTLAAIWAYLLDKRNRQKVVELKKRNQDTETRLSLLSGQLNPHFLFNSLHAIQGTINSSNPDKANAYIGSVAEFMRDVMDTGRKEFISLTEELKIEEDYLKIEQERTSFSYTISLAPELTAAQIDFPPLLLQPVLENSIRHAFSKDLEHPEISINIYNRGTTLIIELNDNGTGAWNTDHIREGQGLSLTRKRIAVYNEKLESMSIQLHIDYIPGKGTMTTFTLQNWLA